MTVFIELLLIGIGLAMDAFAVSVCKGLAMSKVRKKEACIIALFFGGFQAFMPFLGWLLGTRFQSYIERFDHWVVFMLLGAIGGKMIFEAVHEKDEVMTLQIDPPLKIKELTVLAIATSIDALAVGITFAILAYPIVEAVTIIGISTFLICVVGVYVGNFFGSRYKSKAEIAGGIILILIGLKILLEHLGILA